jgi:hypothetical protein
MDHTDRRAAERRLRRVNGISDWGLVGRALVVLFFAVLLTGLPQAAGWPLLPDRLGVELLPLGMLAAGLALQAVGILLLVRVVANRIQAPVELQGRVVRWRRTDTDLAIGSLEAPSPTPRRYHALAVEDEASGQLHVVWGRGGPKDGVGMGAIVRVRAGRVRGDLRSIQVVAPSSTPTYGPPARPVVTWPMEVDPAAVILADEAAAVLGGPVTTKPPGGRPKGGGPVRYQASSGAELLVQVTTRTLGAGLMAGLRIAGRPVPDLGDDARVSGHMIVVRSGDAMLSMSLSGRGVPDRRAALIQLARTALPRLHAPAAHDDHGPSSS